MNVEYRCPVCSSRLFAAPGGTKLHCPRHTEVVYVQVEEYHGPDFLNVDEKGHTESKDIIGPENTRLTKDESITNPATNPGAVIDPEAELSAHRTMYESLTGLTVDKRWGTARIQDELKEFFGAVKDGELDDDVTDPESDDAGQAVETVDEDTNETATIDPDDYLIPDAPNDDDDESGGVPDDDE